MEKAFKIEVIKSIKRLPTLPVIFEKVLETIDDPRSSARILEETIKNDQSISAKVLSMANSAYYGYSKRVSDLSRAIVILGFDMVKNIALSVSVFSMFPSDSDESLFEREKFWMHSIACGYLGKILADHVKYPEPDKAFIACLLHDIGKVVLSSHFDRDFEDALKIMKQRNVPLRQAEFEVFGFNHSDVGAWLGEKWDFPEELHSAILYHHDPERAPQRHSQLTHLTYLANLITQQQKIGQGGSLDSEVLDGASMTALRLDTRKLSKIRREIDDMKEKLEQLLQVMN